ncbi:MAG: lipocalin family protein [Bacteroidia bacterium]
MKKMNILKLFTTATLVPIVLSACNKYEDGPDISLIPRTDRMANTWIFAYAESNGENVSDQFDQYELYMNTENEAQLDATYVIFGTSYQTSTSGTWAFTNDQQNLLLDFDDDAQDNEYEILRLANKELWLRDLDQDLELHLLEK